MIGSKEEVAACWANDGFRGKLLESTKTVVCKRCVLIGTTLQTLLISGVRNSCIHHFHAACVYTTIQTVQFLHTDVHMVIQTVIQTVQFLHTDVQTVQY